MNAKRLAKLVGVSDCGVALDSFDRATGAAATSRPSFATDHSRPDLRRMERILRPVRRDAGHGGDSFDAIASQMAEPVAWESQAERARADAASTSAANINILLGAGATAFVCGITLLVTASVVVHAAAWRWGFAVTTAGEGLLIAGLAAMTAKLWRNSRRLNLQIDGIDRRLVALQPNLHADTAPGSARGSRCLK